MNFSEGKQIVISNHTDKFVEWISIAHEYGYDKKNIIIYDRKDLDKSRIEKYGTVIKSPNVGSNIYDIGRHIYENYDNLADFTIFLKCNLLQRTYTYEEKFRYALKSRWLVPIDNYMGFYSYPCDTTLNQYTCVEPLNQVWITPEKSKIYPKIKTLQEFLEELFYINHFPKYIGFCPAANYVVPKDVILKYSKNFYKKIMGYTDHHENPDEAHLYERILYWAWSGTLLEKK